MFVKLAFTNGHESIYQCSRFFLHKGLGDEVTVALEAADGRDSVQIGELDRREVSIFVMNDQGKTFEVYYAVPAGFSGQTSGVVQTGIIG